MQGLLRVGNVEILALTDGETDSLKLSQLFPETSPAQLEPPAPASWTGSGARG